MDRDIFTRMTDYFDRQISFYERLLADAGVLELNGGEGYLAELVETQARMSREMAALAEEFWLLKREWDETDDTSEDQQTTVRALAAQAQELALEVEALNRAAMGEIEAKSRTMKKGWDELRKGRTLLKGYRLDGSDDAGLVDRKA